MSDEEGKRVEMLKRLYFLRSDLTSKPQEWSPTKLDRDLWIEALDWAAGSIETALPTIIDHNRTIFTLKGEIEMAERERLALRRQLAEVAEEADHTVGDALRALVKRVCHTPLLVAGQFVAITADQLGLGLRNTCATEKELLDALNLEITALKTANTYLQDRLTETAGTYETRLEHVRKIALTAISYLQDRTPYSQLTKTLTEWRRSIDPSFVEPEPTLTLDQINAIQRVGRDEEAGSTSIALCTLDALCAKRHCDRIISSCSICGSLRLCAADCSLAPWNFELVVGEIALKYPAPSRFAYLLRQRRWAGSPVDLRDIFFVEDRGRRRT